MFKKLPTQSSVTQIPCTKQCYTNSLHKEVFFMTVLSGLAVLHQHLKTDSLHIPLLQGAFVTDIQVSECSVQDCADELTVLCKSLYSAVEIRVQCWAVW